MSNVLNEELRAITQTLEIYRNVKPKCEDKIKKLEAERDKLLKKLKD